MPIPPASKAAATIGRQASGLSADLHSVICRYLRIVYINQIRQSERIDFIEQKINVSIQPGGIHAANVIAPWRGGDIAKKS
jgi:hypothetical protein